MAATALWFASGDPRWAELLQHAAHDTYHLPSYHALAETMGEGEARLFAYAEGERFVALPLLVWPVAGTDGLRDATSVYGYAGPVISALPPEPELLARFREALRRAATAERIVAVFSRLHPLLDQTGILTGLGDLRPHGSTVSIDLTLPEEQQIALYSQNHRRNITRLVRHGFECYLDDSYESLNAFIAIYHENMHRVGAGSYYLFDERYFAGLRERLGPGLSLLVSRHQGEIAGGALFLTCGGIVQYHLGAVRTAHLPMAPLKQLLDAARRLFAARGATLLHLGGGRGGGTDSLFHFKAGFSDRRHPFATWRWIVQPETYAALVAARGTAADSDYFPAYRG